MMSNLAVLFVAITSGLQLLIVSSIPTQEVDLRTLLELARELGLQKDVQPVRKVKYEPLAKEEDESRDGTLTSHEVRDRMQEATHGGDLDLQSYKGYEKDSSEGKEDIIYRPYKDDIDAYADYFKLNGNKFKEESQQHDGFRNEKYNEDRYKYTQFNERALEELLKNQARPRNKLTPNALVGSYELKMSDDDKDSGYSKVYVLLNPRAIEKSTNKDELSNLLLKILSATSGGREKGKRTKEFRYKGFPVKRRSRRDSREMYGKDSAEEVYKPKRVRSDRGGAGGGAGGRTAIPYIRQRGDIYERDN